MNKLIFFLLMTVFSLQTAISQQFKTHAVKEGETVESIAVLYKIRTADILRLNPEVKGGLKANTILVIPTSVDAEDKPITPEVTISQQVTFKQHKVRRKETLFGISQRYKITIDDIKRYNKELYSRELKKGERIRIPKFLKPVIAENVADSIPEGLEKYIVKPKQGKWRIAYEHGITVKELEELNPDLGESLKDGEEIYVPRKAIEEKNQVIDTLYNYYTVKPKEGFFRLKLKLGKTEKEIRELNPELQDGELLRAGMIIKIPKENYEDFDVKDGLVLDKFILLDSISTAGISNIALIMPFRLNKVDTDSLQGIKQQIKGNRLLGQSIDFHTGVLMALDSAKQLGLSVNVKVYDSEANENVISNLLANNDFKTTDAVIGPFYPKPFNTMSSNLQTSNIPIFAPFSKSVDLKSNVFQTLPSDEVLYTKMVTYLDKKVLDKNLVIIADSASIATKNRLLLRYPTAKYLDPIDDQFIRLDELQPFLDAEKENFVIVETKSVSLLANLTSVLNSAMTLVDDKGKETKIDIKMFTTNKNSAFDSGIISNFYLSNLNFHYPTIDKFSPANSKFFKKYQKEYGSLPNRFAIRGFDLTMDVILRLAYKKDLFYGAGLISETEYIENKFNYNKHVSGGYINTATYIAYYDDLEIKLVK